jgi:phosphopantothenate---cysteine ligase (ATP)
MIVSFKLETDASLLVHKARYSLERYQHHLVIGNLLATRKWEVVFVAPGRPDHWIRVPLGRRKKTISGLEHLVGSAENGAEDGQGGASNLDKTRDAADRPLDPASLPEHGPELEIESLIIPAVEDLHSQHIAAHSRQDERA